MLNTPDESNADAMRRRAAAWARGADEGRAADRARWAAMTPSQRADEALELIEAAELIRAGRGEVRLAG